MKAKHGVLLIVSVLFGGTALGSITVRPEAPSPAAQLLRAMARGHASAETVVASLARCSAPAAQGSHGCVADLEEVLSEFAQIGERQKEIVLQGLSAATRDADAAWGENLRKIERSIRLGERPSLTTKGRSPQLESVAQDGVPPGGEDIGRLAGPVFDARLFAYVEGLLPEDPDLRVRRAFEAGVADSCEAIYGGRAAKVCSDLGLWNLQRASLWVAVKDLRESRGDPQVIGRYLRIDKGPLEAALDRGETSTDTRLATYMRLIRGWTFRRPTRWEAWADIEELLGPR